MLFLRIFADDLKLKLVSFEDKNFSFFPGVVSFRLLRESLWLWEEQFVIIEELKMRLEFEGCGVLKWPKLSHFFENEVFGNN